MARQCLILVGVLALSGCPDCSGGTGSEDGSQPGGSPADASWTDGGARDGAVTDAEWVDGAIGGDAGPRDGASQAMDATVTDGASPTDASTTIDSSVIDAAVQDASTPDAGVPDGAAAVQDASLPDAAFPDGAVREDEAVQDASLPDAAVPDGATGDGGVTPDGAVVDGGLWQGCPGEDAYVGGDWDVEAQVTQTGVYCATFNESRTMAEEYEAKAMVRFAPGTYRLNSKDGTHPFALPVCVRFRDAASSPVMAGAGSLTTTSSTYSGTRHASMRWTQPLRTPGGEDWELQGSISTPVPNGTVVIPLDGAHVFADEFYVNFTLCKGACQQYTDWRRLDSCVFDNVGLQRHQVEFMGGNVQLDIRIGQSMASTEPGLFVGGQGELDGISFTQLDYWSLIYVPEHHHFARHFLVLFDDPPSSHACGVMADGLTPWPDEMEQPVVSVVDCFLQPTETRAVLSHVYSRL